jgi:hypothetical protein
MPIKQKKKIGKFNIIDANFRLEISKKYFQPNFIDDLSHKEIYCGRPCNKQTRT